MIIEIDAHIFKGARNENFFEERGTTKPCCENYPRSAWSVDGESEKDASAFLHLCTKDGEDVLNPLPLRFCPSCGEKIEIKIVEVHNYSRRKKVVEGDFEED